MSHEIVAQIRDTAKGQGMLAGSALMEFIEEYDRIRYLCEGLVTAYEKNDDKNTRKVIEIMRMLL